MRYARKDCAGRRLKVGQVVRVVGIPDLSDMRPRVRREVLPVFEHLVGKYKRIASFDRYGHAHLFFRIRKGEARRPSLRLDRAVLAAFSQEAQDLYAAVFRT